MSLTTSLAFGVSWLVSLACQIAVIVVTATVVRRHRPDAYVGLLVWAIASLVWSLVHQLIVTAGPAILMRRSGVEGMVTFQATVSILSALVHVGIIALFIRGLVRIAQPARPAPIEPVGPYR